MPGTGLGAQRIRVNNVSRNETGNTAVAAFEKHAASPYSNGLSCSKETDPASVVGVDVECQGMHRSTDQLGSHHHSTDTILLSPVTHHTIAENG
jgi:hypothetical protein